MNIYAQRLVCFLSASLLMACASPVGQAVSSVGNAALSVVGLADTSTPPPAPKQVQFKISAGDYVNSDSKGHGFAVVMRVYALRGTDAFNQLPRDAFDTGSQVPDPIKSDVLVSREQILLPGQQYTVAQNLPPETRAVGMVVFFQSAQPARWRVVLPVESFAADKPLLMGVHRCSFTITDGLKDKELQTELSVVGSAACN